MKKDILKNEQSLKTDLNTSDFLWKIINRFDFYMGSTNTKATVVVAFNTFVFSAIILKWRELLPFFGEHRTAIFVANILMIIAAMASLASLTVTYFVINPYLKSPKIPTSYHSKLFFGHVSEFIKPEEYHECVKACNDEEWVKDLCFQAHALADGLANKFKLMKLAILIILWGQLLPLALILLIKLSTIIIDASK